MHLALDIGNSALKGGLFSGSRLVDTWCIPFDEGWEAAFLRRIHANNAHRVGISSVVPTRTGPVAAVLRDLPVMHVHVKLQLPFEIAYETPLGADRLAAVAGAHHLYAKGRTVVVVDAGTAVTYDVLHAAGKYLGGSIGIGLGTTARALAQAAAQLPAVDLRLPDTVIGRSTEEGLQAGIMAGFIDQISGMLHRITRELRQRPFVVVTGGWHSILNEHVQAVDCSDPHLVLKGVNILLGRNPTP